MVQEEGGSSSVSSSPLQQQPYWVREMKSEERGLCLIHLLVACANHVASGNMENANIGLEYISHLASPHGDTMQRIAAYFTQALADRLLKNWPGLHKALKISSIAHDHDQQLLVHNLFFDFCPFLKLSYVITNQGILEAMEAEKFVHIIDLNCFHPAQWLALIQALSARPEGAPHLRITGVHRAKVVLEQVAHRLNQEAENLDIAFQFCPIVSSLDNLDVERLRVKTGEAVAISSPLQLHSLMAVDDDETRRRNSPSLSKSPNVQRVLHMSPRTLNDFLEKEVMMISTSPDSESSPFSTSPKLASFLNGLWGLSPKLMVVTEQESNHNGGSLMERMMEALNFYAALFDCLESTVPIASIERRKIEKMLYGQEINNIIACEGVDRKERHEKLEKWIPRLELAGFGRVALSYHVMLQARRLLQSYNYDGIKVKDENGCFIICWQDQPLFSVSAWRFRRF